MKTPMHFRQKFSRPRQERERVRVSEDLRNVGDGYYRALSQKFRSAQIFFYVSLFLFTVIYILSNTGSVTYENLYYFLKDFHTAVDNTDASGNALSYEIDTAQSFSVYKGGLAVAGSERLQLFTAAGRLNSSSSLGFYQAKIRTSTERLLICDAGGTTCQIYNSFTRIHTQNEEGRIRTAALSESGHYATVTEDGNYASVISVYNKHFRKVNRIELNSYVLSVDFDRSGKRFSALSFTCTNGEYSTRLLLTEPGTDRVIARIVLDGEYPLGSSFMDDGSILLLTEKRLYRVDTEGECASLADLSAEKPTRFAFDGDGIAIATKKTSIARENSVIVFDKSGEMVYNISVNGVIDSLSKKGSAVFVKTDSSVERLSAGGIEVLPCDVSGVLLSVTDTRAMVCGSGQADYFDFDGAFDE